MPHNVLKVNTVKTKVEKDRVKEQAESLNILYVAVRLDVFCKLENSVDDTLATSSINDTASWDLGQNSFFSLYQSIFFEFGLCIIIR